MSSNSFGAVDLTTRAGMPMHYPFGPVHALDLYPRYAELSRDEPVSRVRLPFGGDAWLLTGYPEIKRFLADPRFSSLEATLPDTARVTPLPLRPGNLLTMDPPEHTRIRRVVAKAFTMRRVERLRDRIQQVADEQLDLIASVGPPADLVAGLAVPLPVVMICELFGIPYQERERFRQYSDVFVATTAHDAGDIDRSRAALEGYLTEILEQRRLDPTEDLSTTLLEQVASFVAKGEPLVFTIPSFPCKSPNPAKVLGHLPDYGELLALRSLQRLCIDIGRVYPAGARMLICSDGHVFADLIRVRDEQVTEYASALRLMIKAEKLDRVGVYNLDDVYGDIDYDLKRALLTTEFGQSLESLRAEVKSDERTLRLYRGITRFMVEDATGPLFAGTKSALLRDSRQRAYGVIQRSRAWSNLIDRRIDRSVRLSIHPQACGTAKFGLRLLDISDSWMTPWHSVAVQTGDVVVLMKRHAAEQIGHLVVVDGRPSHYVASAFNAGALGVEPTVDRRAS